MDSGIRQTNYEDATNQDVVDAITQLTLAVDKLVVAIDNLVQAFGHLYDAISRFSNIVSNSNTNCNTTILAIPVQQLDTNIHDLGDNVINLRSTIRTLDIVVTQFRDAVSDYIAKYLAANQIM